MIEVDCNLCGRNNWRVRFPATHRVVAQPDVSAFRCTSPEYGTHPQIVQCRHCGLVYANPRWSAGELTAAYEMVEDEVYVREREGRELTFEQHLSRLEEHTGPAGGRSLLDVGAYIGVFVEIAGKHGWRAEGVEPSSWAVTEAKAQNLAVFQGTQNSPLLDGRRFDVITMWDVIEHFADPAAELRRTYQLLKLGGWLAVHTMDINSVAARLMGSRWPWLMDMHLYYFSRSTLNRLLVKSGFDVVWSGVEGRYLRLGYIANQLRGISPRLGQATAATVDRLNLAHVALPVNFGDLFTIHARRPT